MSHLKEVTLEPRTKASSTKISTRILSGLVLAGAVFTILYFGQSGYRALTDSWVAPINLSPDNDKIIALKLQLNHQLAEKNRIEAALIRLEGEEKASQKALVRLEKIRSKIETMADWNAEYQSMQLEMLRKMSTNLDRQRDQLQKILWRDRKLLIKSERQLKVGLIGKSEYDKQRQAHERIALSLQETTRKKIETTLLLKKAEQEHSAWVVRTNASPEQITASMPTVLAHEEEKTRLDMEIFRLQSQLSALDFEKRAAENALAKLDEILQHIKSRPMYRAMEKNMDIAFVPYEELENIAVGDTVNTCVFSFFHCQKVGMVKEIVPGEVVTQDPWGELARGQYIVLDLLDKIAIHEKTLRVRPT